MNCNIVTRDWQVYLISLNLFDTIPDEGIEPVTVEPVTTTQIQVRPLTSNLAPHNRLISKMFHSKQSILGRVGHTAFTDPKRGASTHASYAMRTSLPAE